MLYIPVLLILSEWFTYKCRRYTRGGSGHFWFWGERVGFQTLIFGTYPEWIRHLAFYGAGSNFIRFLYLLAKVLTASSISTSTILFSSPLFFIFFRGCGVVGWKESGNCALICLWILVRFMSIIALQCYQPLQ